MSAIKTRIDATQEKASAGYVYKPSRKLTAPSVNVPCLHRKRISVNMIGYVGESSGNYVVILLRIEWDVV